MQSLYKVIKSSSVVDDKPKEIITNFQHDEAKNNEKSVQVEDNAKAFIDSYENLAKNMIENARRQSEIILSSAYTEAEKIEEEAYEKAYNLGKEAGYNDGFKTAYEEGYQANVDKALAEAEVIKNNADNILKSSVDEKNRYLKEKEQEIKNLIINCVEAVLKREIKDKEALNEIIYDVFSEIKNSKSIIIKSNSIYCEGFKKDLEIWKEQVPIKGEVFIIPDDSIEEGSAVIERDNGKVVVSVDIAMESIKEIFNSVE